MPANTPVPDVDWFKFFASAGHNYDIRTMLLNDINSGGNASNDTLLYLYASDAVTQLDFNDDVNNATWYMGYYYYRESWINWTAPASGWYYVKELQWGPTAGNTINDCHAYRIWVYDTVAGPTPTPTNTPIITPTFTPTNTPTRTSTPTDTPTDTPTFTPTSTPTSTPTPMPLAGASFVQYSAMLLNAPDFGLAAQTISGTINGGVAPYSVTVYVKDPAGNERIFAPALQFDGTSWIFFIDASTTEDNYFGCDVQGIWTAKFDIVDSDGHHATSTSITWAVSFPRVHAIP
jgi:hypothetical protein